MRYVLEMNQGWFAKKSIKTGSKLAGAPFEQALSRVGRPQKKAGPRSALFMSAAGSVQPKFLAAKSQFTSLARKVSTNFGRRLR